MSITAYRVNKIEYGNNTFNLSHDPGITEWLADNDRLGELNTDGAGMLELTINDIENILMEAEIRKETKEKLLEDMEFATQNNQESIRYILF